MVAWHGSLQHETIHGHPTRFRWLNEFVATPPLTLWLPYRSYRESHLKHHASVLTDPVDDPESFYVSSESWQEASAFKRGLYVAEQTLLGRLILGPWHVAFRTWSNEVRLFIHGDRRRARLWLWHAITVAALIGWLHLCQMDFLVYVLCFAWPGTGLTLLRSFIEHSATSSHDTAVVRAGWFWSLLYLHNNLHSVHHENPAMAWYDLPREWKENAELYQRNAEHLTFAGYDEIFRRFFLHPKDGVVHPST